MLLQRGTRYLYVYGKNTLLEFADIGGIYDYELKRWQLPLTTESRVKKIIETQSSEEENDDYKPRRIKSKRKKFHRAHSCVSDNESDNYDTIDDKEYDTIDDTIDDNELINKSPKSTNYLTTNNICYTSLPKKEVNTYKRRQLSPKTMRDTQQYFLDNL